MARIAISGCGGIGKTTLARALSKQLCVPCVEENFDSLAPFVLQYNRLCSAGGKQSLHAIEDAFNAYTGACRNWFLQREHQYAANRSYVADRTGFDVFIQFLLSNDARVTDQLLQEFLSLCQRESGFHDLIVMLPLTPVALEGGANEAGLVRRKDLRSKILSHSTLIGLVQQFSRAPCLLLRASSQKSDTVDDRIAAIMRVVNNQVLKPRANNQP